MLSLPLSPRPTRYNQQPSIATELRLAVQFIAEVNKSARRTVTMVAGSLADTPHIYGQIAILLIGGGLMAPPACGLTDGRRDDLDDVELMG